MLNLDKLARDKKEQDNWSFRMIIIGPSVSGKTNTLLHLIDRLHPIDKIYLYAKDLSEPKYEYLIKKKRTSRNKNSTRS